MPINKKPIIDLSREHRKNPTPSEKKLWEFLRLRRFMGLKFLRQKPVSYGNTNNKAHFFIADFYCAAEKLIVEVDGEIHNYQKEYNRYKDEILTELGYRVFRIKNEELKNVEEVLKQLEEFVKG